MEEKLTSVEAYSAMINFLEMYYQNTSSEDIAVLLGGMQFLSDKQTADPAAWHDWLICIEKVKRKE